MATGSIFPTTRRASSNRRLGSLFAAHLDAADEARIRQSVHNRWPSGSHRFRAWIEVYSAQDNGGASREATEAANRNDASQRLRS